MTLYKASSKDGAAWITGASTGIGAETARRLAEEGYVVYASARSADELEALAKTSQGPGKIVSLPLDVTDRKACETAVDQIVAEHGAVSLAIFCAGTFLNMSGKKLSLDSFHRTFDVNFFGVTNCLVPVSNHMKSTGRGHLMVVASVSGYGGLKLASAYGASKAALINMCESLKFDFDDLNIRIQLVNPGFVDTPLTRKNDFPMPFLISVEKAAERIIAGLKSEAFEITFPRRFTWMLKFANLLPYWLYFPIVGKATSGGSKKRTST